MENERFILEHAFGEAIQIVNHTQFVFTSSAGILRVTVPEDFPESALNFTSEPELPPYPELYRQDSILGFLSAFVQHYEARYSKKTASKLELFDSHSHFLRPCFESFGMDFDRIRADFAGRVCIISASPDPVLYQLTLETAALSDLYCFSAGIHPHRVAEEEFSYQQVVQCLADFTSANHSNAKFVAFGETGFSCAEDDIPLMKAQKKLLEFHLQLAQKYKKPIIVHAHRPYQLQWVIDELRKFKGIRGVSHGFGGTPDQAIALRSLGWYGSFNLRTSSQQMKKIVKTAGLEFIMLETDSPYSQEVSQPAAVRDVAQKLSEAVGEPIEKVVSRCNANAFDLYGLSE